MNNNPIYLPSDIKPSWLNVIRRLQSAVSVANQGFAIVSINIVVDGDGNPKIWTEPKVTRIEPKKSGDEILSLLASLSKPKRIE